MALIVDDLLTLPVDFFTLVINVVIQTAYKSVWSNYRNELNVTLMTLRRDYDEGRITREEMRKVEAKIFEELRLANRIIGSQRS